MAAASPPLRSAMDRQENCPLILLKGPIQRLMEKNCDLIPMLDVEPQRVTSESCGLRGFVVAPAGRSVFRIAILFVSMCGAFGMIGSIFQSLHRRGFKGLVGVRKILD